MLIEVVRMAYFADEAPKLGRAADLIDAVTLPTDHPLVPMLAASSILARVQSGQPEEQVAPLPEAVREIRPERLGMTLGNLAIHSAFLRMIIGDADEAWAQTERMLVEARERGLIGGLPHILLQHAQAALVSGRLQDALRTANEGVQVAEDTGQLHSAANLRGVVALITAMTGDEKTCVALANEAIHLGAERHSSGVGMATLALAILDLGYGRYTAALERLASLPPQLQRHPTFAFLSPPEWAEAAARSGAPERAADTMAADVPWATRRDNPVVQAHLHRCRALLGEPEMLETYAAERRPAARRIVTGTRRATRMTLLRRPPAMLARRHIAPLVLSRRRVRNTIQRALSQLDISYREPGEAAVAGDSVVTGDRAPDAPVRHHGVAPLRAEPVSRLFDVIRRDEFSLLLVGVGSDLPTRYPPIHRVAEDFPMVHEYLVLPDADAAGDEVDADVSATVLVDVGNNLRAKYEIDSEAMLLIRPDGYLALRHDEWAPERLSAELRHWLEPAKSTLLEEK